ncbi:hypothetical protein BIW11_13238 [Tropilaelaps mercedesae]|uniref:Uncharacterized protein n=1 Tax=Tropilaelaps mercedesae TaxID=418985 RepID=A0A1V9X3C9_9ACAR|nr:hypothetical protein BIW11_13238 [Tropilaelaps mercedesae]
MAYRRPQGKNRIQQQMTSTVARHYHLSIHRCHWHYLHEGRPREARRQHSAGSYRSSLEQQRHTHRRLRCTR